MDSVAFKETNGTTPSASQDWWYSTNTCGPYVSRTLVAATTGTVIAGWDYQTTTNTNGGTAVLAAPATPKTFKSNAGVGTMYLDGTNGSSDWVQATELNGFGGTGVNATGTGAGGNGLDPVATGVTSLALTNNTSNGKAATFKFSMTGFQGVTLSYATRGTSTGFASQQWAWSTDATNWTDIEVFGPFTTSFALKTLAPLTALDGAAEAYLRVTFAGSTATSGNNRLDNVVLLSNPVTSNTVVTSYAGPTMGIKQANGTWFIGAASTTPGTAQDTPGSLNYAAPTYTCGDPNAGDCAVAHGNGFCADSCCCAYVCGLDAYCCTTQWDAICVTAAAGCATNCSGSGCPADFDADRTVAGADLGILLGGWGGADQDLNADGIVNGADLGILLGAWGACP